MYCVVDFETTGFSPESCDVIEYAAMRVSSDGDIGLYITELCRPGRSYISQKITQITGITAAMTNGKRSFEEALPDFLDFLRGDTLVAHNVPFDMGFLARYCREANYPTRFPTLCTLQLARRKLQLPSYRLEAVANHLSIGNTGFHRALADVQVTAQVFKRLALETA